MSLETQNINDFKKYINNIIDEVLNGHGEYQGNVSEHRFNGEIDTFDITIYKKRTNRGE